MVAPVTGPFTEQRQQIPPVWPTTWWSNSAYADRLFRRVSYRQRRPYQQPLDFTFVYNKVDMYNRLPQYSAANGSNYPNYTWPEFSSQRSWAKNGALAKFNGKVKETASWLITLAEHRQAMQMMTNRLIQMGSVVKHLSRGRVDLAAKDLGVFGTENYRELRSQGKLRANARAASNNFIELSFGWRPIVSDIYASADILQRPIPIQSVKAMQRVSFSFWTDPTVRLTGFIQCTIGAFVSVSNPNLFLANSLGLINPALLAFEVIPWSFVLGWFVNVEQFLQQFTEYAGLNVQDPYYTEGSKIQMFWLPPTLDPPTGPGMHTGVYINRTVGRLPSVDLVVKKPWHLSAWRGATAAALVVQNLTKFDPPDRTRVKRNRRLYRWTDNFQP